MAQQPCRKIQARLYSVDKLDVERSSAADSVFRGGLRGNARLSGRLAYGNITQPVPRRWQCRSGRSISRQLRIADIADPAVNTANYNGLRDPSSSHTPSAPGSLVFGARLYTLSRSHSFSTTQRFRFDLQTTFPAACSGQGCGGGGFSSKRTILQDLRVYDLPFGKTKRLLAGREILGRIAGDGK